MDADISTQDRYYRRGMVLGFTLAEIMVLIIFALLLAVSWHLAAKDKEIDKLKAAQEQEIAALREKVETLEIEAEALEEQVARGDDFDDLFRELEQAKEQRAAQEQEIAALHEKVEALEIETKPLKERATVAEKFMEMAREAGVPTDDPEKAVQEIASHLEQLANVREGMKAAGLDDSQITEFVENSLSKLAKAEWLGKGTEMPACWTSRTGKSEYIFDVALTSRGIITHDNALPHRTAEQAQLPLQTIVFDQEVQPEQFLKMSRPVFEWSKREGCRFFVRISDRTKGEEKTIYKQLLWTVGQHFYSYQAQNGAF